VVHRRQQRQTLWEMVDQLDDRLRLPIILRYRTPTLAAISPPS